jgi:hypothetical protein
VGKSKKRIEQAAKSYVTELVNRHPGIAPTISLDAPGGFDAWISVEVPPELMDAYEDILEETVPLEFRHEDETGVTMVTTVEPKEAVNG